MKYFRSSLNVFTVLLSFIFLISSFSLEVEPVLSVTGTDMTGAATYVKFADDKTIMLQPGEKIKVEGYEECTVSPLQTLLPPFTKEAKNKVSVEFDGFSDFKPEYFALASVLPASRKEVYKNLSQKIGNTKLEKYSGYVPNNNKIWLKHECDNPFGSHYDRVYLNFFKTFEEKGIIKPGDKVLETTSGSAGISFAGIGSVLGYKCHVVIPKGGEQARVNALKEVGAEVIFTNEEEYVIGFPKFLKRFLPKNRDFTFFNHSMGKDQTNNEITLSSLEGITQEAKRKIKIDIFMPASGNGSSILGPSRSLDLDTKVITFESFQSAVAYDLKYPGKYKKVYGIEPGTLSRHKLPGTSYNGMDMPHLINSFKNGIVDDVKLVSDEYVDQEYKSLTGKNLTEKLPHWDKGFPENFPLGRSTQAGIAVAKRTAKDVKDKNMLVIAYDKANRYDN